MRLNDSTPDKKACKSQLPQSVHRLEAVNLIWRAVNRDYFKTEADYQEAVDAVSRLLAVGRLVIIRRVGDEIQITCPCQ